MRCSTNVFVIFFSTFSGDEVRRLVLLILHQPAVLPLLLLLPRPRHPHAARVHQLQLRPAERSEHQLRGGRRRGRGKDQGEEDEPGDAQPADDPLHQLPASGRRRGLRPGPGARKLQGGCFPRRRTRQLRAAGHGRLAIDTKRRKNFT